jgi:hypothetical protein
VKLLVSSIQNYGEVRGSAMARDQCPFGVPFSTKAECEKATGKPAKRCGRCRGWHPIKKKGRSK